MSKIKTILWDIDGTLLNFAAAEKAAIHKGFEEFKLGICTEEMLRDYSEINRRYWKSLERGELTKKEVLEGRFREFFGKYDIDDSVVEDFNRRYQENLGETICFEEGALELVKELQGKVKQYAVTNGTRLAQNKKLKKSGLEEILDGVFISEEVGAEKPNIKFFQKVFREIGIYEKDEVLIVGDSLTSDMRGGNNAGILCCWYNPAGEKNELEVVLDYTIEKLEQIKEIL